MWISKGENVPKRGHGDMCDRNQGHLHVSPPLPSSQHLGAKSLTWKMVSLFLDHRDSWKIRIPANEVCVLHVSLQSFWPSVT
jgi:hypothetical protein